MPAKAGKETEMNYSHPRATDMRADLKRAAQLGRGGDDRIAHINSVEAAILKALGGAGTTNPETGLEEFYQPEGGSGKAGDTAPGGRNSGRDTDRPGQSSGGRGGGNFGGGPSSVGAGLSSRQRNLRDLENLAAGRPSAIDGASGQPGNGQGGRGGLAATGGTTTSGKNYSDARDDPAAQENTARNQDAQNIGESWGDGWAGVINELGHMLGGAVGLGEREESLSETADDMSQPDYNGPAPGTPDDNRAQWGWDPVSAIAGIGGMLAGLPFGPGLIADQVSAGLGRPFDIDLGPDVIGSDDVDPETGEVVHNQTHTGGAVTIHDSDNPGTLYGTTPTMGALASGASSALPGKKTYSGTNPAPTDPVSEPFTPTTPNPSPIDTAPNGIQIDVGNSGLSDQQLTDLFAGFMQMPRRTSRGRNAGRVIV
jgi:hypothetical protein